MTQEHNSEYSVFSKPAVPEDSIFGAAEEEDSIFAKAEDDENNLFGASEDSIFAVLSSTDDQVQDEPVAQYTIDTDVNIVAKAS